MSKMLREIQVLSASRMHKQLYVAFTYPTASAADTIPYLAEHLRYMAASEAGVFLSGPFLKEGQLPSESMTILHTDSEIKAAEFMRNDPLVRRGLRRFDLKRWEILEGTLTFSCQLSAAQIHLK